MGKKVRETIKEIGGTMPEDLEPETHIKKLEQKKNYLKKQSGIKELPKRENEKKP